MSVYEEGREALAQDDHAFQGVVTKLRTTRGSAFARCVMDEAADRIETLAAALRALLAEPPTDEWESRTENRIHYRYGVNSGIYSGYPFGQTATHVEQQRRFESETSGPVDVTKRESRTVLYGPWEVVPGGD